MATLIEKARTHFRKPHLHEIAAGTVGLHTRALDYLAQSQTPDCAAMKTEPQGAWLAGWRHRHRR